MKVHVENRGKSDAKTPVFNLFCDGKTVGGAYFDEPSTALPTAPVPSKAFDGGTVLFGTPAKCKPAVLQAKADGKTVRWNLE